MTRAYRLTVTRAISFNNQGPMCARFSYRRPCFEILSTPHSRSYCRLLRRHVTAETVSLNSPSSERRSYGGVSNFSTQRVRHRSGATLLFHSAEVCTGPTRAVPRSDEDKPPPVCCRCHGVRTPTRLHSPLRKDLYCYSTISFRATD